MCTQMEPARLDASQQPGGLHLGAQHRALMCARCEQPCSGPQPAARKCSTVSKCCMMGGCTWLLLLTWMATQWLLHVAMTLVDDASAPTLLRGHLPKAVGFLY